MSNVRQPTSEMGPTEIHRGLAISFVVACVLSLLAVSSYQHILPSGDDRGLRGGPFADFVAALGGVGKAAAEPGNAGERLLSTNRVVKQHLDDLERALEESSYLKRIALPTTQWLLRSYGGIGNERVYLGQDGWLYLRGGFDYLTGPPFLEPEVLRQRRLDAAAWRPVPQPDPRLAIVDFAGQLKQRGIHLLIMPAPTKAMIHPEPLASSLSAQLDEGLQNPSFENFRHELEAAGITVFDPAPALRQARRETGRELFLRSDSHWSPEGLDAVASALAERIQQLELPFKGRPVRWRRQVREVKGVGDLERAILLPPWQERFIRQEVRVQRVISATGRTWSPDSRAEILLLGDSFTNIYSDDSVGWGQFAGLAEQLSYYLNRPMDRLAINDGGASGTRERLAEAMLGGRDRLAGKRLVILQFAIRELAIGDWQVIDLGS